MKAISLSLQMIAIMIFVLMTIVAGVYIFRENFMTTGQSITDIARDADDGVSSSVSDPTAWFCDTDQFERCEDDYQNCDGGTYSTLEACKTALSGDYTLCRCNEA